MKNKTILSVKIDTKLTIALLIAPIEFLFELYSYIE